MTNKVHKSFSGKQRMNGDVLEIFICEDYCDHTALDFPSLSKPDCIGDYYPLTFIQALIKGENK